MTTLQQLLELLSNKQITVNITVSLGDAPSPTSVEAESAPVASPQPAEEMDGEQAAAQVLRDLYRLIEGSRYTRRSYGVWHQETEVDLTDEEFAKIVKGLEDAGYVYCETDSDMVRYYGLTREGYQALQSPDQEESSTAHTAAGALNRYVVVTQTTSRNSTGGKELQDKEIYASVEQARAAAAADDIVCQLCEIDHGDGEWYVNVYEEDGKVTGGRTVHATPERAQYYATRGKTTIQYELKRV